MVVSITFTWLHSPSWPVHPSSHIYSPAQHNYRKSNPDVVVFLKKIHVIRNQNTSKTPTPTTIQDQVDSFFNYLFLIPVILENLTARLLSHTGLVTHVALSRKFLLKILVKSLNHIHTWLSTQHSLHTKPPCSSNPMIWRLRLAAAELFVCTHL